MQLSLCYGITGTHRNQRQVVRVERGLQCACAEQAIRRDILGGDIQSASCETGRQYRKQRRLLEAVPEDLDIRGEQKSIQNAGEFDRINPTLVVAEDEVVQRQDGHGREEARLGCTGFQLADVVGEEYGAVRSRRRAPT